MTIERPVEIELKYAVADRAIGERLLNADTLAGFRAIGGPRPTQHEDRYVDSADGALARAGFAARLRTAANGTMVNVKSIAEGEGALHRREELEGPADRTPDAASWPASGARSLILELCGDAPLVELVTIRQFRRRRDLELPSGEGAVELSLDEVDVVSRGRVIERFLELELELTRGSLADLAPLQALLDGHHGLSPARGSKLERALVAAGRGTAGRAAISVAPADERSVRAEAGVDLVGIAAAEAAGAAVVEPDGGAEVQVEAVVEPEGEAEVQVEAVVEPEGEAEVQVEPEASAAEALAATPEAVEAPLEPEKIAAEADLEGAVVAAAEPGLPDGEFGEPPVEAGAAGTVEAEPTAATEPEAAEPEAVEAVETQAPEAPEALEAAEPPPAPAEPRAPTSGDGPVEGAVIDLEALEHTPELIEEAQAVAPLIYALPAGVEVAGEIPVGRTPGVTAEDLHSEAGRKIFRFHLARLMAREPGTREGVDPEELHAMRVATRRMRAAWRVFGDGFRPDRAARFRRRLRIVAARLGAVRDLDVLIEATEAFAATLPSAERDGLDPLLGAWREQREAGRRLMINELDSARYRRFLDDYRDFVLTPGADVQPVDPTSPHRVRDTAGSRIWTAYEHVRAYESVLKWADVPTLHLLRIEAKRLRYTLEFVREALGPEAPALISRVVALQDHLGAMNDAEVASHMARAYLVEHAGELTDVQASAISRYLVAREREVARLKRTAGVPWRSVAGLTFRRALGRTIAAL
jgi:CHAD domain-containing protein